MTGSPNAGNPPRVLLVVYTGHRYAVQHFEILLNMGCRVDIASYYHKTREHIFEEVARKRSEPWDLVIQMGLGPDQERIQGLEFVEYTARTLFPDVPVLVLSGHNPSYVLPEVLRHGAADFLQRTTPNEAKEFEEKVRALLAKGKPPR